MRAERRIDMAVEARVFHVPRQNAPQSVQCLKIVAGAEDERPLVSRVVETLRDVECNLERRHADSRRHAQRQLDVALRDVPTAGDAEQCHMQAEWPDRVPFQAIHSRELSPQFRGRSNGRAVGQDR